MSNILSYSKYLLDTLYILDTIRETVDNRMIGWFLHLNEAEILVKEIGIKQGIILFHASTQTITRIYPENCLTMLRALVILKKYS